MKSYTQLTHEQRYQIYILMKAGHTQTEVAGLLEVDKSTISRELRRNRGLKGYRSDQAHRFCLQIYWRGCKQNPDEGKDLTTAMSLGRKGGLNGGIIRPQV